MDEVAELDRRILETQRIIDRFESAAHGVVNPPRSLMANARSLKKWKRRLEAEREEIGKASV